MISQQATQTVNVMTKAGIIRDQGQTGGWNDGGGKARPQSQRCVTGAWGRLAPIASERALTAHRHHRPEFTQLASFQRTQNPPDTPRGSNDDDREEGKCESAGGASMVCSNASRLPCLQARSSLCLPFKADTPKQPLRPKPPVRGKSVLRLSTWPT